MKFLVKKIIMVYHNTKYWNLDVLFEDGKWKQFFNTIWFLGFSFRGRKYKIEK